MNKLIATIATSAAIGAGAFGISALNPAGAQQDPNPTAPTEQPGTAAGRHPKADVLAKALDALVTDGTITQPQADAVVAKVKELAPERGRGRLRGQILKGALETAADTIGIEPRALLAEIKSGKTVAEVATANNVEPQAVIDALVAAGNAKLDEAAASGRITPERANELKAALPERAAKFVNETPHKGG
jgi:polyhydroxyalkanoate synthesis regulator phasin